MKRFLILTLVAGLAASAFALRIPWDHKVQPPVSITEALEIAQKALNKDGSNYYCLSASVSRTFTTCDWELWFHSTNGTRRVVSVGSDKSVRIDEKGFRY